jgi:hypothetical protein
MVQLLMLIPSSICKMLGSLLRQCIQANLVHLARLSSFTADP